MWNAVETFIYTPDEDKTFEVYYRRYEGIYITDCADWTDAKKVRLLLQKLGTVEHNKFVDYILPKKTCEHGFLETVKLLSELFSSKTSLFHKRWKCLNLTKRDSDDYLGSSVGKERGNQMQSFVESRERTRYPTSKPGWRLSEDSECQKRLKKYRGVWCCLRKESQT